MSGKRFEKKTCAYCATQGSSTTGDHVFARKFFPVEQRRELPQVPSGASCNTAKSILEHYLATVMPFGGRHADAVKVLTEMVPGRLAKNAKLHRALAAVQMQHRRRSAQGAEQAQ